jgi:hypothetical protein
MGLKKFGLLYVFYADDIATGVSQPTSMPQRCCYAPWRSYGALEGFCIYDATSITPRRGLGGGLLGDRSLL